LPAPSARIVVGDADGPDSEESFPLVFAGEAVGALRIGRRDEPFTAEERRLLDGIAVQVAAVAHAVALTADLRSSRERVVSASAEERRRLRRDLHDGLGPALAGNRARSATHPRPGRRARRPPSSTTSPRRPGRPSPRSGAWSTTCARPRSTSSGWWAPCPSRPA
jgi:hypothetical protein